VTLTRTEPRCQRSGSRMEPGVPVFGAHVLGLGIVQMVFYGVYLFERRSRPRVPVRRVLDHAEFAVGLRSDSSLHRCPSMTPIHARPRCHWIEAPRQDSRGPTMVILAIAVLLADSPGPASD
jgi:hypothetical protein